MVWLLQASGTFPTGRGGHTATFVPETHVMVVFGGNGNLATSNGEVRSGSSVCFLDDVVSFDTDTAEWTTPKVIGTLPAGRCSHSAVCWQKKLFVWGGLLEGNVLSDGLCILHMDTTPWQWSAALTEGATPSARYGHTATLMGTRILVVFGGRSARGYSNDVHVLDVDSECLEWKEIHPSGTQPPPRCYHSATPVDSRWMIIFGGRSEADKYMNDLFVLDCQEWRWHAPHVIGASPAPRGQHVAALLGRDLFVIGGRNAVDCFSDVIGFNLDTLAWTRPILPGIAPTRRTRHSACTDGEKMRLLVFGGHNGKSWLSDIHVLDLGYWTEIERAYSQAALMCGRNTNQLAYEQLLDLEKTFLDGLRSISEAKAQIIQRFYEEREARNLRKIRDLKQRLCQLEPEGGHTQGGGKEEGNAGGFWGRSLASFETLSGEPSALTQRYVILGSLPEGERGRILRNHGVSQTDLTEEAKSVNALEMQHALVQFDLSDAGVALFK